MRYNSLNNYLKNKFGCKVYKLSLSSGLSCPNRDGLLSTKGCTFCSNGGSGEFATEHNLGITEQIEKAKNLFPKKLQMENTLLIFSHFPTLTEI